MGAKFPILVHDKPVGFFSSTQGIRQGDLLLPSLFIILGEEFNKSIKLSYEQEKWKGILILHVGVLVTNFLFVDDTLLFAKVSISEAK